MICMYFFSLDRHTIDQVILDARRALPQTTEQIRVSLDVNADGKITKDEFALVFTHMFIVLPVLCFSC
jgi:hypothetical protein